MTAPEIADFLRRAARQRQFLQVIGKEDAAARFHAHLDLRPLGEESVPLDKALGRVLAQDVVAEVDVPAFDRSNVDGFALRAADTAGASEDRPRRLVINQEILTAGMVPRQAVQAGTATVIATGGMVPRDADAVVMVEHTDVAEAADNAMVDVHRAAASGQFIAVAGSDIGRGETVLRQAQVLTAREIGVLAAIGQATATVFRRPQVAILSTGDEVIAPGEPLRPAAVYDTNAAMVAAAVEELGGEPIHLGISRDDEGQLLGLIEQGLACDMLILSGGTSKGGGDLNYRVVASLGEPGILVHGVALKPGKPICLAVVRNKPVVILPGFPTSAIFTFHEFVAPVIRAYAGRSQEPAQSVAAMLPLSILSERGRTEYVMVSLMRGDQGLAAYPLNKGSGAVTEFSRADGFLVIGAQSDGVAAGTPVEVHLIGRGLVPADLVVVGSHCVGLDALVGELERQGLRVKTLSVGSMGGLTAAARGECDIAPVHLLDAATDTYNLPFLTPSLRLEPGYLRQQGIVFRRGDMRFAGHSAAQAITAALADNGCLMINRNTGSGTRILTDRLLAGSKPPGYQMQTRSHNAVAAAVALGRADWGLAIENVARMYDLGFIPIQAEHYDFVIARARYHRLAVQQFVETLRSEAMRDALRALGFVPFDPG